MKLQNGQSFPTLRAPTVDGDAMTLPDDLAGVWSILIFYRGHW